MDRRLVWVAQSVDSLYSILEKDPTILEKIDVIPFIHSPLHEASMFGKTDIAMELLILMPSFAKKLNTRGFSPLHLAVLNQQMELARELIKFDRDLIRLRGRGGVTPLHIVAERGDVDLLSEFLVACPESILDVNVNGETCLHIAVSNGRYEELQLIIGWIQRMTKSDATSIEKEFLNKANREGNTALHVAAYGNKHQAVKPLLRCPSLDRNIQNKDGFTPLDILRANGRYMDSETERLIQQSGGKSKVALSKTKKSSDILRSPVTLWESWSTTVVRYRKGISDGTRNALLVITTLIITTTYQTALQPPPNLEFYEVKVLFLLLWGSNALAFVLGLFLTLILLPPGREYIWFYLFISFPLIVSYGFAIYTITAPFMYELLQRG